MHVGVGVHFQNLDGLRTDAEIIADQVELADLVEPQGFDSVWMAEHHFTGYHMCPNAAQLLTYMAARTSRVRLGSMVIVLPWHDPIRVAEELTMVDHLSGGRLVVGFGRGLGRVEFDGLRLNMGESRARFAEYAQAIVEGFETGTLAANGEHYQQPPVTLRPAPGKTLLGRTYASSVSPQSFETMARLGFGVLVIAQKPWETTMAELAQYKDQFADLNGYEPPKPLLVAQVAVHQSEAAAKDLFDRYIVRYARSAVDHYEFGNPGFQDIPGYEYYGKLAQKIAAHGVDRFTHFLADLQVYGTPAQVLEQLTENVRRIDGGGVIAMLSYGGMPPEVARANQDLFAAEVLPALLAIDTDRGLGDAEYIGAGQGQF